MKKKLLISFSGGRTSAFMTKWLLDNRRDQYDFLVIFANTGQEHEKTLEFVHNCDIRFGFNTVWVEAVVHHTYRKGSTHKIVTYKSASRDGQPYEDMIKKYGIPNQKYPHCTRELKLAPIYSYVRSIGWKKGDYETAIGIRSDETRRVSKKADIKNIIYPLVDMIPVDKQDILDWWSDQHFNLDLPEHMGNCTWCWKKSTKKHLMLIDEYPECFDFPMRMEQDYGKNRVEYGDNRVFFRNKTSTNDLFKLYEQIGSPQHNDDLYANSGCSESCEIYDME